MIFFMKFKATVCAWSADELRHDLLVEQPLFLFRCNELLFENDILFPCYLRILSFYLSASRTFLLQKPQINHNGRYIEKLEFIKILQISPLCS